MEINSYIDHSSDWFSGNVGEWEFSNDADGGNLSVMDFSANPYTKFSDLPGFENLSSELKSRLDQLTVFSNMEVEGWDLIPLESERLQDMFGSEVIYVPPTEDNKDLKFFRELDTWFTSVPYSYGDNVDISEPTNGSVDVTNYRSYGLTDSLVSALFTK